MSNKGRVNSMATRTSEKKSDSTRKTSSCHAHLSESEHPDHSDVLPRLRRAMGQLTGIEKMILERRYCADVLVQFQAVSSALKSAEAVVLEKHIRSCVKEAMLTRSPLAVDKKITELMK